jgi:probable rRNA maturation factor
LSQQGQSELDLRIDADDWKQISELTQTVTRSFNAALDSANVHSANVGATIVLADNSIVKKLNNQWRNKNNPTNILSFPAPEGEKTETGRNYLGDMILAFEVVNKEALQQSKALETHLCHLVIHGALHLLGHDHLEDAAASEMENLERTAMTALNLPDPYLPTAKLREKVEN